MKCHSFFQENGGVDTAVAPESISSTRIFPDGVCRLISCSKDDDNEDDEEFREAGNSWFDSFSSNSSTFWDIGISWYTVSSATCDGVKMVCFSGILCILGLAF